MQNNRRHWHGRARVLCLVVTLAACGCQQQGPSVPALTAGASPAPAAPATEPAVQPTTAPATSANAVATSVVALASTGSEAPTDGGVSADVPRTGLTEAELAEGWIELFDGQTLFGWEWSGSADATSSSKNSSTGRDGPTTLGPWVVRDGVIACPESPPSLLATTTRFANYELKCEARLSAGGNAGLFLRTVVRPTDPAVDCYEFNLCDTHPAFPTGGLVKRQASSFDATTDGEWHAYHIIVNGPRVQAFIDGRQCLDYTDETALPLRSGRVALQSNGGLVEYRAVRLKPLGGTPLFDGASLAGWHVVPGSQGEFTVDATEHAIRATSGRGFLETDATADNFVLQFDVKTEAPDLNSGLFFRALTGTEAAPSHGYEFQVHNGAIEGDLRRPKDHGTGAIFRRAHARWVAGRDQEWVYCTLVADGPHLTTWVNGLQMVDWFDTRASNDNPREGRRDGAGHFSLQGHDPTTKVLFRGLELTALPATDAPPE